MKEMQEIIKVVEKIKEENPELAKRLEEIGRGKKPTKKEVKELKQIIERYSKK